MAVPRLPRAALSTRGALFFPRRRGAGPSTRGGRLFPRLADCAGRLSEAGRLLLRRACCAGRIFLARPRLPRPAVRVLRLHGGRVARLRCHARECLGDLPVDGFFVERRPAFEVPRLRHRAREAWAISRLMASSWRGVPLSRFRAFAIARAKSGAISRLEVLPRGVSAFLAALREPGFAIRREAGRSLRFPSRRPRLAIPALGAVLASGKPRPLRPLSRFEAIGRPLLFGNLDCGRGTIDAQHAPPPYRALFFHALEAGGRIRLAAQISGLRASGRKPSLLAHWFALHAELAGQTRAELILQHAYLHFLDGAGLQVAEHERPEGNADEAVHGQAKMLQDVAHLAVLALPDRDRDPDIIALFAFERRLDRAEVHPARSQARRKLVEFRLLDLPVGADAIPPGPARGRQLDMPRKIAVVGQEKKPLRVEIEPADGDEPRQLFGERFENGGPSLRVFVGGHAALRLVVPPQARRLAPRERLAVHEDDVGGRNVQSSALDYGAVHRNAFFPNQDFGVSS